MLWVCLLLPHLALDGVLRQHADPGPLVLVDGPPHARVLVAVNDAAHAAGLRVGQRLAAAETVLARFACVPVDARDIDRHHALIAAVAYRYSAEVSLLPEAVVLEVSRSRSLFGEGPEIARRLQAEVEALGFRHRIAAAPTPHAAWLLAGVKDGAWADTPREAQSQLDRVPLSHARLAEADATMLARMGMRTLGQVRRLPRAGLQRRLGRGLLDHLDRLSGAAPAGLSLYRPPDRVDGRVDLAFEVENTAALVFPLRRLTGDLAAFLAIRDGGVQRFVVTLEHREGATSVPVGLLAPEREAEVLFDAARGRMANVILPAPVVAIGLQADHLPPFEPEGRDLFDARPIGAVPFAQLRERLRARLGEDAVVQLRSTTDPRPERSQDQGAGGEGRIEQLPRPTWLLPRPMPLRGPAPAILAGPERIETGWWDGEVVRRDYYIVRTSQGQRAWVFCPPGEPGRWMLHGWFA
ncbi:DNA polymerase Y family protein [Dyella sp. A6]|uniref:Y-family DNA polymerase n=1 Tax=Dyella aluminiiresistens TaxID=3069105 RepID=UPI002E79B525|nr:DNA polymerase Y family protein [Dyella sp. A6]